MGHRTALSLFEHVLFSLRNHCGRGDLNLFQEALLGLVELGFGLFLVLLERLLLGVQDKGHGRWRWNAFTTNIFIANTGLLQLSKHPRNVND